MYHFIELVTVISNENIEFEFNDQFFNIENNSERRQSVI